MTDESRDRKPKREQSGGQSGNGKGLDREAQNQIGRMLKATYDEVAHQPVPDKILDLLKQLQASEPRK